MNKQNTTAAAAHDTLNNIQTIVNLSLKRESVRRDQIVQHGLLTLRELAVQQANTIVDLEADSLTLAKGLIEANKTIEALRAIIEENEQAAQ